jgi:vanillate/3-O-methylgallate O-demethylase
MADQPHRRKVALLWNPHDVLGVSASWLSDEPNAKFMEMPTAHYSTHPLDRILSNGREIGVSTYPAFTANEKSWLSLAVLSEEAPLGSEVIVVWGEPDGGSKQPVKLSPGRRGNVIPPDVGRPLSLNAARVIALQTPAHPRFPQAA